MKICYLATSDIPSRTANSVHVMKMCQAYARLGHDVTLVTLDRPERCERGVSDAFEFYDVEEQFNIRRLRLRRPGKVWLTYSFPRSAVRLCAPDLIHTRVEWAAWGLAEFLRKPCILELHEDPFRTRALGFACRRAMAMKELCTPIAITKKLAQHTMLGFGNMKDMIVEPDAVDSSFLGEYPSKFEARSEVGLEAEKRPIAVYIGSLYAGRGIDLIVDLARRLYSHLFIVVGGRSQEIASYQSALSRHPKPAVYRPCSTTASTDIFAIR